MSRSCPLCRKVEGGPHDAGCLSAAAKRQPQSVPFDGKVEIIPIEDMRPTDIVVLSLPQKTLSQAEAQMIEVFLRGTFPRNKHILLVNGQKIRILRPATEDKANA